MSLVENCWSKTKIYEPQHDKTNELTCAPSEDSDQPAKTQISLGIRPVWPESSLCALWVAKDPKFLHADSEDSDQTERMPRLIWVFAGQICHFVGFVTWRLIMVVCLTCNHNNSRPYHHHGSLKCVCIHHSCQPAYRNRHVVYFFFSCYLKTPLSSNVHLSPVCQGQISFQKT